MELEYLEDARSRTRPVVLLHGRDPNDVMRPHEALAPLVEAKTGHAIDISSLPVVHGIDGCSVIAEVGTKNLGVRPIASGAPTLRCVLTNAEWSQVSGLLEPCAAAAIEAGPEAHQYLSSDGPGERIMSRVFDGDREPVVEERSRIDRCATAGRPTPAWGHAGPKIAGTEAGDGRAGSRVLHRYRRARRPGSKR